jgi:hypothetical protein
MDPETLAKGIGLFASAVAALKQAIALLPDNSKRTEAEAALQQAERQFKIAEAQAATGLGHQLCRNHFPPEVMLSTDNDQWTCPNCGNQRNTHVTIHMGPDTPSRWIIKPD